MLTCQISVQDPVGVEVMNPIKDLVQERLHHAFVHHHLPLVGFGLPVELDDVLETRKRKVLHSFRESTWSKSPFYLPKGHALSSRPGAKPFCQHARGKPSGD